MMEIEFRFRSERGRMGRKRRTWGGRMDKGEKFLSVFSIQIHSH